MNDAIKLFKAISNETRLAIMVLLCHKELCVCQIEKLLNLSQAKASRHLNVLKNAGLVMDRREGLWIYYSAVVPETRVEKRIFDIFSEFRINTNKRKMSTAKLKVCGTRKEGEIK